MKALRGSDTSSITAVVLLLSSLAAAEPPRMLLISVDGLRPDAISSTEAPHISGLIERGAHTLVAQSLEPTYTVPNHASMFTGMLPATHGVDVATPTREVVLDETFLRIARRAGFSTALYLSKHKLRFLAKEGSYDRYVNVPNSASDSDVAVDAFVDDMKRRRSRWDVSFVHLNECDSTGHEHGWMTNRYMRAVRDADGQIGRMLGVLDDEGLLDDTVVVVTSDHGGRGRHHGEPVPEVLDIPWIAAGPGIRSARRISQTVRSHDLAPTVLYALGLRIPREMEGSVVRRAFRGVVFVRPGDVDVDGHINSTDVVVILNYLFAAGSAGCLLAGDANDDRGLNIADPVYLLNHLFLEGPPLPPPYPRCELAQRSVLEAVPCENSCQ